MMDLYTLSFYCIASFILVTAILAVTTRKIFRSAIWLLFSLAGIGALYFWMDMQFLAAVQIIVYVGGVVVLIIFSIFLTQQAGSNLPLADPTRKGIAAGLSIAGFLYLVFLFTRTFFLPTQLTLDGTLPAIGRKMLGTGEGGFALPFEVISILLLAAMVGCIVIALKPTKE